MDLKLRNERLRRFVGKVNKERKKQAQKIDILCNDFVAAHRDFIKTLEIISFAASFYESIVGKTELNNLLYAAGNTIKENVCDVNIAFFLRRQETFELHLIESDRPVTLEKQDLESCFTPELVENICKSNKQCTFDDLLEIGLQVNPAVLKNISAITIPLGQLGTSLGFILIYCPAETKLTSDYLNHITAIVPGLSKAINSCRLLSQTEV
jgi:hypothetical protein